MSTGGNQGKPATGRIAAIHLLLFSHSTDVRTTDTGRSCQPRVRRGRRGAAYCGLMFNANTNEQTTHDPSWVSWEVPAGHSTTPQDPTLPTSQHGPQRSAAPPDKNDPGICDQRGPRVASMAGNTQHRMECVTSHSLLTSGKPCGNARGRLVREGRFQPLVTLLSGCYVYLARAPAARPGCQTKQGPVW